jgi:hypothetical protein
MLTMKTWKVEMVSEPSQKFIDLNFLSNQYYHLKPDFIEKLLNLIEKKSNYSKRTDVILSVTGPKDRVLTKPFLLLLATIKGLVVTFLGDISNNSSGFILGVWPNQFKRILETDSDAIINLLYVIVERPDIVLRLELVF